eukprot:TRINITY_DN37956_c0_g1_i1.p1 TRINITY_DN37956_c0_g1~~TRINITY_DN37956_c0_g1_i1.p1  ORF type:complete len:207 (+),score=92.34 TRINITY_DN37956_c0_g1_i1:124-744(+)
MLCRAVLLLICWSVAVDAFTFTLAARDYKCFNEELPADYDFSGKWSAAAGYSQFIDVKITNPYGQILLEERNKDKSVFHLTTTHSGDHTVCFYNTLAAGVPFRPGLSRDVTFSLNEGADAHDYTEVAKLEHLKPIEVNLRMMEDTVRAIHAEYQYFKKRESEMRETSESTNSRAMWITVISMTSFFLFGVWQVSHMKKHFRERKLI